MPLAQFKKKSSLSAICCSSSCSNREPRWEKNTKKVFLRAQQGKVHANGFNEWATGWSSFGISGTYQLYRQGNRRVAVATYGRSRFLKVTECKHTMNNIAALNSTARDCSSCRRVRKYILKFEEVEKKKTSGWRYLKRRSHRASCTVPCIVNSWLNTSHLSSLKVYLQRLASHSVLELELKWSVDVRVEFKIPVSYILAPYWTLGLINCTTCCTVYSRWLIWFALISGFLKLKWN